MRAFLIIYWAVIIRSIRNSRKCSLHYSPLNHKSPFCNSGTSFIIDTPKKDSSLYKGHLVRSGVNTFVHQPLNKGHLCIKDNCSDPSVSFIVRLVPLYVLVTADLGSSEVT
jgi:hypothetical protein